MHCLQGYAVELLNVTNNDLPYFDTGTPYPPPSTGNDGQYFPNYYRGLQVGGLAEGCWNHVVSRWLACLLACARTGSRWGRFNCTILSSRCALRREDCDDTYYQ